MKLLRVLEGGEYQPLGSTETLKANVRIITATNKELFEQIKKGHFREDLFYRINVVQIDVPPLRQRREDIPLLMKHFLKKLNLKRDKTIGGLSPAAERILLDYDYPGNIQGTGEHPGICNDRLQELPDRTPPFPALSPPGERGVPSARARGAARQANIDEMEREELLRSTEGPSLEPSGRCRRLSESAARPSGGRSEDSRLHPDEPPA